MLTRRPDESTELGALAAAIGDQPVEIWQENVAAVEVFADMLTQWNVGPGGAVGLRYEALPLVLDLRGTPAHERADLVAAVRVMERAALGLWRNG
jgi:hypothetical protein